MTEGQSHTPERETVTAEMPGASALLFLGGEIHDALSDEKATELGAILRKEELEIPMELHRAATYQEIEEHWGSERYREKSYEEQMQIWKEGDAENGVMGFTPLIDRYQKDPEKEVFLKSLGITREGGADGAYEKYWKEGKGDYLKYIAEIEKQSKEAIEGNMEMILSIGQGLYGKDAAERIVTMLRGRIEAEENREGFIQKAKADIAKGAEMPGRDILNRMNELANKWKEAHPPGEEPSAEEPVEDDGEDTPIQPQPVAESTEPTASEPEVPPSGETNPPGSEDETASTLTLELAESNPDLFKKLILERLQQVSTYGSRAWELLIKEGIIKPEDFTLNTDSWISDTSGNGTVILGVAPMDEEMKGKIFFQDKDLSYADEIAHKLINEIASGLLIHMKDDETVKQLHAMIAAVREVDNSKGLTAQGSLEYYKDQGKKIQTDAEMAALIEMYMWNPQYLQTYLDFLRTADDETRTRVGLAAFQDTEIIFDTVRDIVEKALPSQEQPDPPLPQPERTETTATAR